MSCFDPIKLINSCFPPRQKDDEDSVQIVVTCCLPIHSNPLTQLCFEGRLTVYQASCGRQKQHRQRGEGVRNTTREAVIFMAKRIYKMPLNFA